jgi:hypothetical protein
MNGRDRRRLIAAVMGGKAAVIPWYLAGDVSASICIAAYQPKGAASLAASYTNLANPGTYDAVPVTAPGWDTTTGWTGGSSAYLSTGITPDANWSTIIRYASANSGGFAFGTGNSFLQLLPYSGSNTFLARYGGADYSPGAFQAAGVAALTKNNIYFDGSPVTAVTTNTFTGVNELYILNRNGLAAYFTGSVQAFAIYNAPLTDEQVLAITEAMNDLP